MLNRVIKNSFVFCLFALEAWGQMADPRNAVQGVRETASTVATESSLLPILELLDKAKLSGSLEFSGHCDSFNNPGFPEFPPLRVTIAKGKPPLQILREMFIDDPKMRVTQDASGIVRMVERGVPNDILNVRIGHIALGGGEGGVYNANAALNSLVWAPNVQLFLKAHDIEWPFTVNAFVGNVAKVSPVWPHISGYQDTLTLLEAMDNTLKTFPGIWIYENCPRTDTKSRFVFFQFYHLQRTGFETIVE